MENSSKRFKSFGDQLSAPGGLHVLFRFYEDVLFYGIRNPSKGDISSIRASAPIMAVLIMMWLRVASPFFMAMPVAPHRPYDNRKRPGTILVLIFRVWYRVPKGLTGEDGDGYRAIVC